jgi:hypothetical protein
MGTLVGRTQSVGNLKVLTKDFLLKGVSVLHYNLSAKVQSRFKKRQNLVTDDYDFALIGRVPGFFLDFASGLTKPASEFGFGVPFLSFKEVFGNFYLEHEKEQLVNSDAVERQKHSVNEGEVFLTRTSETENELGMSTMAPRGYPEATFNGFTKRLRTKPSVRLIPLRGLI